MDGAPGAGMSPAAVLEAAARGDLPAWADLSDDRRAHVERVADLLTAWAADLDMTAAERTRWRAAGMLHDALRDADPGALRPIVPPECAAWEAGLLHGPAAAVYLVRDGLRDGPFLRAITYHTVGHPDFDRLGHALFMADYLEPGRPVHAARRAGLRARMPADFTGVLHDLVAEHLDWLREKGHPVLPETRAFHARILGEDHDAAAH
jgi:2-amino-4-hydroxy-6-hydroxymethyldihydropteridine diphosphokinase